MVWVWAFFFLYERVTWHSIIWVGQHRGCLNMRTLLVPVIMLITHHNHLQNSIKPRKTCKDIVYKFGMEDRNFNPCSFDSFIQNIIPLMCLIFVWLNQNEKASCKTLKIISSKHQETPRYILCLLFPAQWGLQSPLVIKFCWLWVIKTDCGMSLRVACNSTRTLCFREDIQGSDWVKPSERYRINPYKTMYSPGKDSLRNVSDSYLNPKPIFSC